jgi:cell growth-regulating nucleolar protein
VIGLQFLSERPPWKCSCCNVNCTSRDTLLGHASGVKHKRRVSAMSQHI